MAHHKQNELKKLTAQSKLRGRRMRERALIDMLTNTSLTESTRMSNTRMHGEPCNNQIQYRKRLRDQPRYSVRETDEQ